MVGGWLFRYDVFNCSLCPCYYYGYVLSYNLIFFLHVSVNRWTWMRSLVCRRDRKQLSCRYLWMALSPTDSSYFQ